MRKVFTEEFVDTDDYQAGLSRAGFGVQLTAERVLAARVTFIELGRTHLVNGQEDQSRIAYLKLGPSRLFVTFPVSDDEPIIWCGASVARGELIIHRLAEQMYQRTTGRCRWSMISVTPDALTACNSVLNRRELPLPTESRIIRPSRRATRELQRLHRCANRLAGSNPCNLAHPEVARALDHDFIQALVDCLTTGGAVEQGQAHQRRVATMNRFAELLAANRTAPMPMQLLCESLGLSKRSFELCCVDFLGMGPIRYMRLRRMHAAHSELRQANLETLSVAEIARRNGFSELGRFAVNYRSIFGESPSDTLRNRLREVRCRPCGICIAPSGAST